MKLRYSLFTVLFILSSCGDMENGVDGNDGMNILVKSEVEPSGSNCPSGGTKLSFGGDINGNMVLSVDEITSTFYVCNGEDGQDGNDGQDGQDGTSNLSVSMIQMNQNTTDYVEYDGYNHGMLRYEFSSDLITDEVLENGMVFVEHKLYPNSLENWMNLPMTFVSGDENGVDFTVYCYYYYQEGRVLINWESSLPLDEDGWNSFLSWGGWYKISILSPT